MNKRKIVIEKIRASIFFRKFARPLYLFLAYQREKILIVEEIRELRRLPKEEKYIFHLGIPTNTNMGDLAQYYLIRKWYSEAYPDYRIVSFSSRAILAHGGRFLNILETIIKEDDYIVFQSGYDTHDLGGCEDEMHQKVIEKFPNQKMVMMPQTVFFRNPERKRKAEISYNQAKRLLFLARDEISYGTACEMFPQLAVRLFPDIVTTLIGKYRYKSPREGILLCLRDDGEKYYGKEEMDGLEEALSLMTYVMQTDTTKRGITNKKLIKNIERYLSKELEVYSHYQLVITDRYHGTIFSLIAGTPVIILQTNDHKVTSGLDWFKERYSEAIFLASDVTDAIQTARRLLNNPVSIETERYFKQHYYDHLQELIKEEVEND